MLNKTCPPLRGQTKSCYTSLTFPIFCYTSLTFPTHIGHISHLCYGMLHFVTPFILFASFRAVRSALPRLFFSWDHRAALPSFAESDLLAFQDGTATDRLDGLG